MKAVLCPVCNGKGYIYDGLHITAGVACHGCAEWGSKGWVVVPEDSFRVFPDVGDTITISPDTADGPGDTTYNPNDAYSKGTTYHYFRAKAENTFSAFYWPGCIDKW